MLFSRADGVLTPDFIEILLPFITVRKQNGKICKAGTIVYSVKFIQDLHPCKVFTCSELHILSIWKSSSSIIKKLTIALSSSFSRLESDLKGFIGRLGNKRQGI
jgi:hypothetical protein